MRTRASTTSSRVTLKGSMQPAKAGGKTVRGDEGTG